MEPRDIQNLMSFNRTKMAEPFDGLTNKKVSVISKFGTGTQSTLSPSMIKAINAVCKLRQGTMRGAIGTTSDGKHVIEYKSAIDEMFDLVVYDPSTGNIVACKYDKAIQGFSEYAVNTSGRDGTAVLMAMFLEAYKEQEFRDNFEEYYKQFESGFSDFNAAQKNMAVMSDNVYRRLLNERIPENIKAVLDAAGHLVMLNQTHIDKGDYNPYSVFEGEFEIFSKDSLGGRIRPAEAIISNEEFVGKYKFHQRDFSLTEQSLIPTLPEWYVVPEEVIEACEHIQRTTDLPMQMRNFMFRGEAGTGKTMGAQAIAAGCGIPYMKFTCSSGTELFDLIGQMLPETSGMQYSAEDLEKDRQALDAMGGITFDNVYKLMNFPTPEDVEMDPEWSYEQLTGESKKDATSLECNEIIAKKVFERGCAISGSSNDGGQRFRYTETDLIKALKYGYLLEIQEPSTIIQPAVLVGLNSVLEQSGSITLMTGEVVKRHPDTIIVITTNVDYEGCRPMNESVMDRMNLIFDINLPSKEVLAQRAMSITSETDEDLVMRLVNLIDTLSTHCKKKGISGGSVGMRGLIDCIRSYRVTNDLAKSVKRTIVGKATSDIEVRDNLIAEVVNPLISKKAA